MDAESWYRFDESEVDAIAEAVDAAAEVENQAHHGLPGEASTRLGADDPVRGVQRALAGTFFRGLRIDADNPARVQVALHGDSASPDSYLPSIQQASQDEVQLWRALADAVTHPLPKSLLHDLLFVRRDGNVGLHAREAIRLYTQAARTTSVNISTRAYSALRALTLSKLISDLSSLTTLSKVIQELIALDLADATSPRPGLTLPMLAAVVEIAAAEPSSILVPDLLDLLESVAAQYGTADHIDYVAETFRLSPAVSDTRKQEIRRARVTTRLDRARRETLLVLKLFLLEEVASEAQKLGYTDVHDEAIAALQQVDTAAMNWVEVGSDIHYPAEVVAGYLAEFTSHGDWKRGLRQWLATDVPSGTYADNEAVARGGIASSPLQSLFPRFRVGTHGMPERKGTPDRLLDDKIRDTEYSRALIEGTLLFAALKEIGRLAGNPSEEELSTLLMKRYRCPGPNAVILAKALILFWRSEYLVCAYFVTPFIEAGVRTLLLELNEPIYRVEVGKSKGQYAQLGALLPKLEAEGFDPDWARYLETLTVSDGQNFRNDLAHGFLRQMDPVVATLLLRASALFLTMPLESATSVEVSQTIQRPPRHRPHRSLLQRIRQAVSAAQRAFRQ